MTQIDALVVGGGPAGTAAAIALARDGAAPLLFERQAAAHDVVCGGFLGWDALAALRRLGVDAASLGARPIMRLRLVAGDRAVETALPRAAAGLSRRALDEALLAAATQAGVTVRRGVTVRAADPVALTVRLDDGAELAARSLFLATGKYDLRGAARPVAARAAGAVGLRTSFAPDETARRRLDGVIELHPFDGGYAGVLMQEDGRANLCLSVAAARLRVAGGIPRLMAQLGAEAPRLGERIAAAAGAPWLTVSNVPYGWRARRGAAGLYRVGDQAAVIASLAGDGIAIALESGLAAAAAHARGEGAEDYQRRWARRAARPLGVAEGLRWAAERPGGRRVLLGLASATPGLARAAARLTRIG